MAQVRSAWLAVVGLAVCAGCGPDAPSLDVVVKGETNVAWASNNLILYTQVAPSAGTDLVAYDPGDGSTSVLGTYSGTAQFLDVDATDRVLLGGVGGAYTFVKQNGTNPITVLSVEDTTEGYTGLHASSGGNRIALATLPPQPDLQVHDIADGALQFDHQDLEGDAVIADLDWALDDSAIYYAVNKGVGQGVQVVSITPDGATRTVLWDGTAPPLEIAYIDKLYVSHTGSMAVLSGRDGDNLTAVWLVDLSGGVNAEPVLIEAEGGRWNRVEAAGGFSPDSTRFLLQVEAPSGISTIIQRIP